MQSIRWIFTCALLVSVVGILGAQSKTGNDENTIRELDKEWSASANLSHLDKFLSFYSDEASVLPFNAPIAIGKDNIRQFFRQLMSKPGFAVTFGPTKISVSKSRDIAYEVGTAELTLADAQGQPATTPAKYVVVWKRDKDGKWKAVADIFNTDK
jgi:uncharacterized protein (TIGR02246 family)